MAEFSGITNGFATLAGTIPIKSMQLPRSCYDSTDAGLWQVPIVGIIHHASVGCGTLDTLKTTLKRAEVSVHFGIDRGGQIGQYLSLERQARHARLADSSWLAVEHIASTKCNHTKLQMESSVILMSCLSHWVNDNLMGHIPYGVHGSGRPPRSGLADHKQGGPYWGNRLDGVDHAPAPTWDWYHYINQIQQEY